MSQDDGMRLAEPDDGLTTAQLLSSALTMVDEVVDRVGPDDVERALADVLRRGQSRGAAAASGGSGEGSSPWGFRVRARWGNPGLSRRTRVAVVRRRQSRSATATEPGYEAVHELLTELHAAVRQLSLGLDPRDLAAALADDIRSVIPQAAAVILARSPGGRFVALAGEETAEEAEAAIEDAWVRAAPVRREAEGAHYTAIPVLMGERVVALVVVTTYTGLDVASIRRCRVVIEQSGPRLASALLFDDVRRLATTDERMRLARKIHDGIAQNLASVAYALDDIRRDSDPEVARQVVSVREQLQVMVADLRMSVFDLRTGIDDTIGLGTALSEHAQRIAGQSDLVVHVSMDESPKRLPITVEVELLRIAQEAITNVRRHAGASNLWLSVTVEPPRAHISVTDDGRGLKPGRPDSFGISGMRERARRIGANLRVGPGPENTGTVVEIGLGTDSVNLTEQRPLTRREREHQGDDRDDGASGALVRQP